MGGEGRWRDRRDLRSSKKQKLIRNVEEELESKLGFDLFSEGDKRLGWLLTFSPVSQVFNIRFHPICISVSPKSMFFFFFFFGGMFLELYNFYSYFV